MFKGLRNKYAEVFGENGWLAELQKDKEKEMSRTEFAADLAKPAQQFLLQPLFLDIFPDGSEELSWKVFSADKIPYHVSPAKEVNEFIETIGKEFKLGEILAALRKLRKSEKSAIQREAQQHAAENWLSDRKNIVFSMIPDPSNIDQMASAIELKFKDKDFTLLDNNKKRVSCKGQDVAAYVKKYFSALAVDMRSCFRVREDNPLFQVQVSVHPCLCGSCTYSLVMLQLFQY
jgi:hypothetical protein